jgi:hypothetical protein
MFNIFSSFQGSAQNVNLQDNILQTGPDSTNSQSAVIQNGGLAISKQLKYPTAGKAKEGYFSAAENQAALSSQQAKTRGISSTQAQTESQSMKNGYKYQNTYRTPAQGGPSYSASLASNAQANGQATTNQKNSAGYHSAANQFAFVENTPQPIHSSGYALTKTQFQPLSNENINETPEYVGLYAPSWANSAPYWERNSPNSKESVVTRTEYMHPFQGSAQNVNLQDNILQTGPDSTNSQNAVIQNGQLAISKQLKYPTAGTAKEGYFSAAENQAALSSQQAKTGGTSSAQAQTGSQSLKNGYTYQNAHRTPAQDVPSYSASLASNAQATANQKNSAGYHSAANQFAFVENTPQPIHSSGYALTKTQSQPLSIENINETPAYVGLYAPSWASSAPYWESNSPNSKESVVTETEYLHPFQGSAQNVNLQDNILQTGPDSTNSQNAVIQNGQLAISKQLKYPTAGTAKEGYFSAAENLAALSSQQVKTGGTSSAQAQTGSQSLKNGYTYQNAHRTPAQDVPSYSASLASNAQATANQKNSAGYHSAANQFAFVENTPQPIHSSGYALTKTQSQPLSNENINETPAYVGLYAPSWANSAPYWETNSPNSKESVVTKTEYMYPVGGGGAKILSGRPALCPCYI